MPLLTAARLAGQGKQLAACVPAPKHLNLRPPPQPLDAPAGQTRASEERPGRRRNRAATPATAGSFLDLLLATQHVATRGRGRGHLEGNRSRREERPIRPSPCRCLSAKQPALGHPRSPSAQRAVQRQHRPPDPEAALAVRRPCRCAAPLEREHLRQAARQPATQPGGPLAAQPTAGRTDYYEPVERVVLQTLLQQAAQPFAPVAALAALHSRRPKAQRTQHLRQAARQPTAQPAAELAALARARRQHHHLAVRATTSLIGQRPG